MTKLKSTVKFRDVTNYGNEPDQMWQIEAEKLIPWLFGKGADVGCGLRTIKPDAIRVDLDENVRPEILASSDNLPSKDGELDYITSVHTFEHFPDQRKVLVEWLRVLKKGGIVAMVHPDVDFTLPQNQRETEQSLKDNPFNRHYFEKNRETFVKMMEGMTNLGFKILDSGVACPNWSFFIILEKL